MRGWLGVAIAAVHLAALVGCAASGEGSDPESGRSSASTSNAISESSASAAPTAPKPAQTFPPEQQAIVDTYFGFYDALYALRPGSDEVVRSTLTPFAESGVVEHIVALFAEYLANGEEPAGLPTYGELELTTSGSTADIVECRDSSTELILDAQTQQVKETGSKGLRIEAHLTISSDGAWRIRTLWADENSCWTGS